MMYGAVAAPLKPGAGTKVTAPVAGLRHQERWRVVWERCWPGGATWRSMLPGTRLAPFPPAVSLAGAGRVTGAMPVVAALSFTAVGAAGLLTVAVRVATFEVWP